MNLSDSSQVHPPSKPSMFLDIRAQEPSFDGSVSPSSTDDYNLSPVPPPSPGLSGYSPDVDLNLHPLSLYSPQSLVWGSSDGTSSHLLSPQDAYRLPTFGDDNSPYGTDTFSTPEIPPLSPAASFSGYQMSHDYSGDSLSGPAFSRHMDDFFSLHCPSIHVVDADVPRDLTILIEPTIARDGGMHLSDWPHTNGFHYVPEASTSAAHDQDSVWARSMQPVMDPVFNTFQPHNDCSILMNEDDGAKKLSRNPQAARKSLIRHYRTFCDDTKLLRIFGKKAKERVSTLNGLRASTSRRKNPAKFFCEYCEADFTRKHNLDNHMKSHFGITDLACEFCSKSFTTIPVQKRHQESCHSNPDRKTTTSSQS